LQKLGQNFAYLERGAPWRQEVSGTFYEKNFMLKYYGRIPKDFGMKRDKFQLKQTSIQLKNDKTVSHKNRP